MYDDDLGRVLVFQIHAPDSVLTHKYNGVPDRDVLIVALAFHFLSTKVRQLGDIVGVFMYSNNQRIVNVFQIRV